MCFLWYFQEYNQTSENIFRKFFWNATKHVKTLSFPENSISGKYLFSGNAFTRTKRSLNPTRFVDLGYVWNFCKISGSAIFNWSNLILNRSSFADLHNKFLQLLDSNLHLNKLWIGLYLVLIMVRQHNTRCCSNTFSF